MKRAPRDGERKREGKKGEERERVAVVMWCEKFSISQLCSLHKRLMSHFAEIQLETPGENGPEQSFKPSTSKVNDMHLIPMSPNKAVRERFHPLISSGLRKEKG